ncbi:MAG: type II toxin-antitoxin system RelE/ParE family toxin [Pseudobdellovibrionaceae bacterium]
MPFDEWLDSQDVTVQTRIEARIERFKDGNFGDYKSVGDGVLEARFFFGSGYRVYFSLEDQVLVLIISAGDKSSQTKDIEKAKLYLKKYLEDKNANKN